jgi:hypothetical protein
MMSEKFKNDLSNCKTSKQMFECINKHYDTDKEIGSATRIIVVSNVGRLIDLLKLKSK